MASDISNIGMSGLTSTVLDDKSGRKVAQDVYDAAVKDPNSNKELSAEKVDNSSKAEKAKLEDVVNQVQSLQVLSEQKGWSVNFEIDGDSDQTIIKVVDAETKEVIRQIPNEEMLTISKKIKSIQNGEESDLISGLLFDRKA